MATADELLATSDVLWVDVESRQIEIPPSIKLLGVMSDDGVQKLKFAMPRFYNDIDLSIYTVYVNYENAKGSRNSYIVMDKVATADTITFTWVVQRAVVEYPGTVKFIVCLRKTDAYGTIDSEFNTAIASLSVLDGIEPPQGYVTDEKQDEYAGIAYLAIQQALDTELKGDPGYTPVKGVDYYTDSEKEELVEEVIQDCNSIVANAFTGVLSGETVRADDVNPVKHTVKVLVHGNDLLDPTTVTVTAAGKNLVEITGKTETIDGVTFTVNDDGSITVNGTAEVNVFYKLGKITLVGTDNYHLSGAPSTSSISTYMLYMHDNKSYVDIYDVGAGKTFTPTNGTCDVVIAVYKGQTVNDIKFYPMVEAGVEKTEFRKFEGRTLYTPSEDGTCDIVSVSPTMTIFTDTAGVTVECKYGRDSNKVFAPTDEYANYNKFIESEVTTGVYLNTNGDVVKNQSYNMTGYIPCRAGKYVYFSSAIKSSYAFIRGIEFLDYDKNRLSFSAVNDATQGGLITFISVKSANYEQTVRCVAPITDEECRYIRIVFPKDVQPALVIEVRDYYSTDPLDVDYVAGQKINPPLEKEIPYWRGKTIAWNGDSIPAGYASRAGYPKIVELHLSCVTSNHSIGGRTLADCPDYRTIDDEGNINVTDQTKYRDPLILTFDKEMPDDADLVCIAIGTNDWHYAYTDFGDMASKGTDTFYGALKALCEGLLKKYLGKPIVFFTPIKRIQEGGYAYWQNNSKGKKLEDYANAIKEVCGYYGIPVLDLFNECLINPLIPEIKTAYIPDGVHPNIHGHKILARRITGYIKQLADGAF